MQKTILAEVQEIVGYALCEEQLCAFQEMRSLGYSNPYDIADLLKEW